MISLRRVVVVWIRPWMPHKKTTNFEMARIDDLSYFEKLMAEHEQIIGQATGLQPIQKEIFPDFAGSIKSLGAWGGDFILYACQQPFENCEKYFQTKGYNQLFRLEEIMLNRNGSV
jgi:hypothetical protein